MIKLTLPPHLEEPLTAYAEEILKNPGRYINPSIKESDIVDPSDTTSPGIMDKFLQNWNLCSVDWGGINLQKNKCNNLSLISFPPMSITHPLITFLEEQTEKWLIKPSGHFLYPKGGYMGWHTNGDMPGIRVYLAYSPIENGSYFKYVDRSTDTPTIVTDWDNKGWTVRVFEVSHHPNHFLWHCVEAPNAPRISFGYWFR